LGESAARLWRCLLGTSSESWRSSTGLDPYSSSAIENSREFPGRVAAVISLSCRWYEFPKYSFFGQQPGFAVLPKEIQRYYSRIA